MLFPDCLPVVEVWLVCSGFNEAKSLAMKINTFFKLISEQVINTFVTIYSVSTCRCYWSICKGFAWVALVRVVPL